MTITIETIENGVLVTAKQERNLKKAFEGFSFPELLQTNEDGEMDFEKLSDAIKDIARFSETYTLRFYCKDMKEALALIKKELSK